MTHLPTPGCRMSHLAEIFADDVKLNSQLHSPVWEQLNHLRLMGYI